MNKTDIKNVRFELTESTSKGYKTVRVVFHYNGEDKSYYIFVKEGKNVNYIAQAKKQFYQDLESGEVARTPKLVLKKSNRPWLIATASVLGVAAIVFMILFVHKCSASNTHIVTFDTLGGSHIDSIKVKDGSKVKKPDDPTKIDYYFGGWFISKDYAGGGYNFDTPVTKDITLYAEWFNATEFVSVTFDGGKDSFIEGVSFKTPIYKTYVRRGTKFIELYEDLKYMGASIKGQDFLYWTIDGERVPNDYVIDGDTVRFNAKYTSTKDGCLTITARVDNCTLTFGESAIAGDDEIQYSRNGTDWAIFTTDTLEIELEHIGEQMYIKRDIETGISGPVIDPGAETNNMPFSISGPLESFVGGNTVLSDDGSIFAIMFQGSSVVSAANLQFDHITALSESCYGNMFHNCSLLIAAPELPTLNLVASCYTGMFHGCSSLVVAPTLPAQVLESDCYSSMFASCASLVSVQKELPITQLAESCCKGMFSDCTSLMTVPALPDNIALENECYNGMFSGCTSLRISENGSGTKIFTCPSTGGFDPSPVQYMFSQTSGLFEDGTPTAGNTYYYY